MAKQRVLITGASGQLGQALLLRVNLDTVEVLTPDRASFNLSEPEQCAAFVRSNRPDWIINAGAYTAVDRAESEPELAFRVNSQAPAALAAALSDHGGRMIQISTDFVFGGEQPIPYQPLDATHPLGVYGQSKREGELAVLNALAGSGRCQVVRTSWLHGPSGHNFVITMLRLQRSHAPEQHPIRVVADQIGSPTHTWGLAEFCWQLVHTASTPAECVLHWADAGVASWFDFAVAVAELGEALGLIPQKAPVVPITTKEYPTAAQRPHFSVLGGCGMAGLPQPQHWRLGLQHTLAALVGERA